MDDTHCLFVLCLLRDGRPVDPELAAAARDHAAAHPQVAIRARDLDRISDAVASLPEPTASAGFTERVLDARRAEAPAGRQTVTPLALRLAAAAALALVAVLAFDAQRPTDAMADPDTEKQVFEADAFRADPYAAPDLDAGLRALLPGPLDADHGSEAEGDDPGDVR
jgi:anti-sigma factor RsiW